MLGKLFSLFSSVVEPIRSFNLFGNNKRMRDTTIEIDTCHEPVKKRRVLQEISEDWIQPTSLPLQINNQKRKHESDLDLPFRTPSMQSYFSLKENRTSCGLKFEKTSPYKKSCRPPSHCKSPEKKFRKMASNEDVQCVKLVRKPGMENRNFIEKVDLTVKKVGDVLSRKPSPSLSALNRPLCVKKSHKIPRSIVDQRMNHNYGPNMSHMEYSQVLGSFINHNLKSPKPSTAYKTALQGRPIDTIELSSDDELDQPVEIVEKSLSRKGSLNGATIDLTKTKRRSACRVESVTELDDSVEIVDVTHPGRLPSSTPDRWKSSFVEPVEVVDLTNSIMKENEKLIKDHTTFPFESVETVDDLDQVDKAVSMRLERVNSFDRNVVKKNRFTTTKWLQDLSEEYESKMKQFESEQGSSSALTERLREENTAYLLEWVTRRINRHWELTEYVPPIKEEVTVFPELSLDMKKIIANALKPNPPDEILSSGFNLTIKRRDMITLKGPNWLNDEVINFYMSLLMERGEKFKTLPRVYAFNTFFYPRVSKDGHGAVKRWTKKVDLFEHELVLVPVHLQMHWCMAVIDLKYKTIKYYDSMANKNNECLKALQKYIIEERKVRKDEDWNSDEWKLENVKGIPQQNNGSDCGVFACTFAEFTCRRAAFSFSQSDMSYLRHKMVYEILTSSLLL